ncbi:MAG: PAS domain-containing sensor histidine kinase [Bacteroidota bacterium]
MSDLFYYILSSVSILLAISTFYFARRYLKLQRSDESIARAFEVSLEGVYFMDLLKNQTRVGDTYYRLLGYEPDEFPFEPGIWKSMIHPEDLPGVMSAYENVEERTDTFVSIEYRLLTKSGDYMWVLDRSRIVKYDKEGRPTCSLGTITKIDQLKLAQESVQEKNEQLEKALKKLKQSQSQVVEMEKMASLGLLTSGIAYELNNPLNYVKGNVHPLKKDFKEIEEFITAVLDADDEKKIEVVQTMSVQYELRELFAEIHVLLNGIEEGAQKSSDIVKTLKMFSEDQNSEIPMLLDLNENLTSAIRLIHGRLNKKITIHKQYGAIQQVKGWPGKLNQVFTSLLSNAIDAIGDGHGDITVISFQDKNLVKVRIEDNGCGIKLGLEEQIFEPFFTTKKGANGLGLSIVATVMKSHQGSVMLKKHDDCTCFELTFPVSLEVQD